MLSDFLFVASNREYNLLKPVSLSLCVCSSALPCAARNDPEELGSNPSFFSIVYLHVLAKVSQKSNRNCSKVYIGGRSFLQ